MQIKQSEEDFQNQIIELAHILGYSAAHFRPARTKYGWRTPVSADGAGFPDLFLVHPGKGRMLFIECKSEAGKLTPEQIVWRTLLIDAGLDYYEWRPSDWDTIIAVLQA